MVMVISLWDYIARYDSYLELVLAYILCLLVWKIVQLYIMFLRIWFVSNIWGVMILDVVYDSKC